MTAIRQLPDSSGDKVRQAAYYDHDVARPEFEINRPHGDSALYRYLMDYKFKRVLALLGRPLKGSTVLVICSGSGMDAEYLARAGATVIAMDISTGCIDRARVRSERYRVEYHLVKGDAENLPFGDGSCDYGFVHDGLHHLTEPERAIAELCRVARHGIMLTEPADAIVTGLPIRFGLMKPYEEAGNYVIRFQRRRLESLCQSRGFDRIASSRYLMKYGHPPADWWRWLDAPPLLLAARAVFWLFGVVLLGRWGNKLAFVAQRSESSIQVVG